MMKDASGCFLSVQAGANGPRGSPSWGCLSPSMDSSSAGTMAQKVPVEWAGSLCKGSGLLLLCCTSVGTGSPCRDREALGGWDAHGGESGEGILSGDRVGIDLGQEPIPFGGGLGLEPVLISTREERWKQPKYLSTEEGIRKMWCV